MSNADQSAKQLKNPRKPRKSSIIWTIVALCALPFLLFAFIVILQRFVPNSTLMSKDRLTLETELRQQLHSVNLEGVVVHDAASDKGCRDQGGFLQVDYLCSVVAQRYLKTNMTYGVALRKADAALREAGYERHQDDSVYEAVFAETQDADTLLQYRRQDGPESSLTLGYYVSRSNNSDAELVGLVASGTVSPAEGEVLYGVSSSSPYWSCSNKRGFFEQPCPQPPSPVKP